MASKQARPAEVITGVILIIVIGMIVYFANHHSSSRHAAAQTTPAAPMSAVEVPPASSVGDAVYTWFIAGPQNDLDAISKDQGAISDAGAAQDPNAMATACANLKSDVVTFESDPSAPDDQVRTDLAQAMDAYSTAATECLAAQYASAAGDIDRGSSWINKVTARITALSGH